MVMPILQIAELVSGGARLTPGQCGADTMRLTPTTGGPPSAAGGPRTARRLSRGSRGPDQLPISSLPQPQPPPLTNGGIKLGKCF